MADKKAAVEYHEASNVLTKTIVKRNPLVYPVLGCIALGTTMAIGYTLRMVAEKSEQEKSKLEAMLVDRLFHQERKTIQMENELANLRQDLFDRQRKTSQEVVPPPPMPSNINVIELSKVIEANDMASANRHRKELEEQRKAMMREHLLRLEGEVLKVENKYKPILNKCKELESTLEEQNRSLEMEAPARILWTSCQALLDRLRFEPQKPLENDPSYAVLKQFAAKNDALAVSILDSIPAKALKEGVPSEESLIDRFSKVDKICRRVAMVDENGGGLAQYLVSYLRSLFIIDNVEVSEEEVTGRQLVDPTSWHTYDILARVRYCLKQHNLEQAIRYANQLRGQARVVARDWIRDAKAHLEIRQALSTLSTHAEAIAVDTVQFNLI